MWGTAFQKYSRNWWVYASDHHTILLVRDGNRHRIQLISYNVSITGLHLRSPRHFAWQPWMWVSQTSTSSCLSHMTAATKSADECWHRHRSDCWNTLTYAHMTSGTLLIRDISLGWLALPAPEAGDFIYLILLYHWSFMSKMESQTSWPLYLREQIF